MSIRILAGAAGFAVVLTFAEVALVAALGQPPSPPSAERPRARAVIVDPETPTPIAPDVRWQPAERSSEAPTDLPPAPVAPASPTQDLLSAPTGMGLASVMPGLSSSAWAAARPSRPAPKVQAVARHRPPARYPREARRRGIEGYVVLRLRVDARGRVEDAVVIEAEPKGVFERSAKRAVLAYRFEPAQSGGAAVASTLEQRLRFQLR